jgi:hypothetical protein
VSSLHFMRLSLKERRTRGPVQSCVQEIGAIDGWAILCFLCVEGSGIPQLPQPEPPLSPTGAKAQGSAVFAKKRFVTLSIPVAILPKVTPLPLSSRPELRRSVVEGSAVRPAALSNASWEASRMNRNGSSRKRETDARLTIITAQCNMSSCDMSLKLQSS